MALRSALRPWESYIADSGYRDIFGKAVTPTGEHSYSDHTFALVHVKHEGVNHLFKQFRCLHDVYRHDRKEHYSFFAPCALLVQLGLESDLGSYDVEYNSDVEADAGLV